MSKNTTNKVEKQNIGQWEFWIDVGGTFTDCLAKSPDKSIKTYKLLSSGTIKGRVGEGSTRTNIIDHQRKKDPPHFFENYKLTLLRHKRNESEPNDGAAGVEIVDSGILVAAFDIEQGKLSLSRPLSVSPEKGMLYELSSDEEAPLTCIRWLRKLQLDEKIGDDVTVRLGTTRGTNALLEKQGAKVGFLTTKGFADILKIGYQNRPRLFTLKVQKPMELYQEVVELDERMDHEGEILTPLDKGEVRRKLSSLKENGIESIAVCLMNAYKNNRHEQMIRDVAREMGFKHISTSTDLVPLQKIVSRGETTTVDAYLTPIIQDYIQNIRSGLPRAPLKMMTNAGGLVEAESYAGKDSILSGPAGGVVGYAKVAEQAGISQVIGFDMGGTSTDVSRFNGEYEFRYEMEIQDPESHGGVHLISPMLWIETVAAGGGSICWFDGQLPRVGPKSAGAEPGPASYGRGGPLTITDINIYLGRILPEYFAFPLDLQAVEDRLDEIIKKMQQCNQNYSREELAAGFARIANSTISAAIKKISIARGYDPRDYALITFGGAGAQHACPIARELGIKKILLHPYGSILSAYGMGMADVKKFAQQDVGRPYNQEVLDSMDDMFQRMEAQLFAEILEEDVPAEHIKPARRMLDLRYVGQEQTLTIPCPEDGNYQLAFEARHRLHYGFTYKGRAIEIQAARVEMIGETEKKEPESIPLVERRPDPEQMSPLFAAGSWCEAAVFKWENLYPGDHITGPALIIEAGSTIAVDPGWEADVTELNNIILEDVEGQKEKEARSVEVDLITLELFKNAFSSIAEHMGATLQKTALSTNIKERLDFSCAIFSREGELVANAPHIPVHLGAMPASVKHIISSFHDMQPGEVYITNDPFHGGSHLPDVTVVTPVFDEKDKELVFFAASRAHHAEIGGITPGSMPPFSKNLAEEGVLIKAFRFISDDQASEEELKKLLCSAKYPTRSLGDNIADIHAQVAANQTGVVQLLELVDRYGLNMVKAYMGHIQVAAENMMRRSLLKIDQGEYRFTDYLDNGSPLTVKINILEQGEAVVDFHGTGDVIRGSLNANTAIVSSAVLYCFRCLIEEDIPLNAGVLKPINIILPGRSFLNPPVDDDPEKCAAVAGGNVETSQRIVDTIFGALGLVAASQGTMNNVSFGREGDETKPAVAYYETIGGGSGAGEDFPGASAVHTHMTNTRLTDPEVLEARYPIRINEFVIRRGSGGDGKYHGGDGIIREIEFLETLNVSLLTGRRNYAPYGLFGGESGLKGHNILRRAGQESEELAWAAAFNVGKGDILIIETPGGGGFGRRSGSKDEK
ncbi:MAG: hydantoinase B/oxoprolinase family protein [Methanobacterium sp.]|nr:hydantoinase B/oxoprolinase family protein [Methanobacterium sp.]